MCGVCSVCAGVGAYAGCLGAAGAGGSAWEAGCAAAGVLSAGGTVTPGIKSPTVPYVATWTGERAIPAAVVARLDGVGVRYADEGLADRDRLGVLWTRVESRPGVGRPLFGQLHSTRQRRAMRRLLCQVCGGESDRDDRGVLWLTRDYRGDWPGWPARMATEDPPVCLACARVASRLCPSLRKGHVFVRSRTHPVVGVRGVRYAPRWTAGGRR